MLFWSHTSFVQKRLLRLKRITSWNCFTWLHLPPTKHPTCSETYSHIRHDSWDTDQNYFPFKATFTKHSQTFQDGFWRHICSKLHKMVSKKHQWCWNKTPYINKHKNTCWGLTISQILNVSSIDLQIWVVQKYMNVDITLMNLDIPLWQLISPNDPFHFVAT